MPRALTLLVALFLAGLVLRPQFVAIGPLVGRLHDDLDVPHAVVGLLGTIPVLCMGVFALPAGPLAARIGSRRALTLALALVAVFGLLRAGAPGIVVLLLLTVPVGIGMGLGNALLAVVVKERFADIPARATGVYASGVQLGALLAGSTAVPLAAAFGGWRGAFTAISLAALLSLLAWVVWSRGLPAHAAVAGVRVPWGNRLAWGIALFFALIAILYYGAITAIPEALVERGWSDARAGFTLGPMHAMAIVSTFLAGWLVDRFGSRRIWLAVGVGCMVVGLGGIAVAPSAGLLWCALFGVGNGVSFTLVMTLPQDVADRPADVGAVSGLVLGAGYTIGAVAPSGAGGLRDLTGSYAASLWVLVAVGTAAMLAATLLSPDRLARGVRRTGVGG